MLQARLDKLSPFSPDDQCIESACKLLTAKKLLGTPPQTARPVIPGTPGRRRSTRIAAQVRAEAEKAERTGPEVETESTDTVGWEAFRDNDPRHMVTNEMQAFKPLENIVKALLKCPGPRSKERVLQDWNRSVEHARTKLSVEKVKGRVAFLQEDILSVVGSVDISLLQVMDVFQLLMLTYRRYGDDKSQAAVQVVGMELISRDEQQENKLGVSEQAIGWLSTEVGRYAKRNSSDSYAPADLFVPLNWTYGIYTICVKKNENFPTSLAFKALVGSMALLLDMVLESSKSKDTLKKGALVRARRALRSSGSTIPVAISTLLGLVKANASQNPIRFFTLVGVAFAVLVRQKLATSTAVVSEKF